MPLAIEDMNAAWVEHWWAETAGLAQDTRVTRLGQVRAFLRYCRERGWLTGDPTALINAKAAPVRERDRLDADELLALLELAKYPLHRALLALAMNLGLRGSEMARLRISDVDLDGGTILTCGSRRPTTSTGCRSPWSCTTSWSAGCGTTRPPVPGLTRDSLLVPSQHVSGNTITYRPDRKISEPYEIVKRYLASWAGGHGQAGGRAHDPPVGGPAAVRLDRGRAGHAPGKAAEDSALLATMTFLHHSRPETTLRYIGKNHLRDALDTRLRGKAFLSALGTTNVRRLDVTA
jgi:integrase